MTNSNSPPLRDSVLLPLAEKRQVLTDWSNFLRNDFKEEALTDLLYRHLVYRCLYNPRLTREDLWHYYFSADTGRLKRFLNQFGGDHSHAEGGSIEYWMSQTSPSADVNAAMRRQMEQLYPALIYELDIISQEMYQTEKWASLFQVGDALDVDNQRLLHWSEIYEEQLPFEEYADLIRVTTQTREWLGSVARHILDELRPARPVLSVVERQASLFDLRPPQPAQVARQPDLFMNLHLPLPHQQSNVADKLAADDRRRRLATPVEVIGQRKRPEAERRQLELTTGGNQ